MFSYGTADWAGGPASAVVTPCCCLQNPVYKIPVISPEELGEGDKVCHAL
jgi:hypothetical protein